MKKWLMLTALTSLTACDYVQQAEFKQERGDREYRAAMEDYRAGKIDAAVEGFRKAAVANPANASARFQLACLLQDAKEDYFGAYCAYVEYLAQRPSSEKASLAKSRLIECERKMATVLAAKYGLNAIKDCEAQIATLKEQLRKNEKRTDKLKRDFEFAMQRTAALVQENERLKGFVRAEAKQDATTDLADEVAAAKALQDSLPETDGISDVDLATAKALLAESEEGSPLLPHDADVKAKRDAARAAEKESEAHAPKKIVRPETYVIQDGDTLYKIAIRFYGRSSAWKLIREANKTLISTDGRVRTGQKIVLPNE